MNKSWILYKVDWAPYFHVYALETIRIVKKS